MLIISKNSIPTSAVLSFNRLFERVLIYNFKINPFHAPDLFLYLLKSPDQKTKGFLMFSGGTERDHGMK